MSLHPFPSLRPLAPLLAATFLALPLTAQDGASADTGSRLSMEIDPATFAFGGYSAHLRFQPSPGSKWVLGIGTYAMDFPKGLVDLDSKNRGKGWDVRLQSGIGVFVDRYLHEPGEGAFLGLQVASQRYQLRNSRLGTGSAEYTMGLAMARAGYLWKPTKTGLYVMPWVGLGWTQKASGEPGLGGESYHLSKVIPFATLHVGWAF
ncbi:MAG TPA: hypothetical protein VNV60_04505 [Holophagaceae bacterium]|nr:hypothetical protein [Holophagaceae bacterium]